MAKRLCIAIDGPSASGKGTVARQVATALGYTYLDSGALYRCVALAGQRDGVSLDDGPELARRVPGLGIRLGWEKGQLLVRMGNEDIGAAIRSEEMGQGASRVARLPEVRAALLDLQRTLAEDGGIVMDGRDIGTVVLPTAELKIFLTASVETRALRRHEEQLARGLPSELETVKAALVARDEQDRNREHAPLCEAEDAIYLDSSHSTPEEVVEEIVALAVQRSG